MISIVFTWCLFISRKKRWVFKNSDDTRFIPPPLCKEKLAPIAFLFWAFAALVSKIFKVCMCIKPNSFPILPASPIFSWCLLSYWLISIFLYRGVPVFSKESCAWKMSGERRWCGALVRVGQESHFGVTTVVRSKVTECDDAIYTPWIPFFKILTIWNHCDCNFPSKMLLLVL